MDICIYGGDRRMLFAARRLQRAGLPVYAVGFEKAALPKGVRAISLTGPFHGVLLTGTPLTKDGETVFAPFADRPLPLRELTGLTDGGTALFTAAPGVHARLLQANGAALTDLLADEALLRKNAALTAEALLGLLIAETPKALAGLRVAVLGYGRIGSALTKLLLAVGAAPTVFARRAESRLAAEANGADACPITALEAKVSAFDTLVNTVPARVVGTGALRALRRDCVLLEAASSPFGIDPAAAKEMGLRLISAGGLPGKYAPQSAGEAIADAVLRRLKGGGTDA